MALSQLLLFKLKQFDFLPARGSEDIWFEDITRVPSPIQDFYEKRIGYQLIHVHHCQTNFQKKEKAKRFHSPRLTLCSETNLFLLSFSVNRYLLCNSMPRSLIKRRS